MPSGVRSGRFTVADVVEVWAPTGGGIRSWVEAKAHALRERGDSIHLLVVPGAETRVARTSGGLLVEIRSPPVPRCPPYRFLLDRRSVLRALRQIGPDVVEIGSQYRIGPTVQRWRAESGGRLAAFLHTDLAGGYIGPWARRLFGRGIGRTIERRVRAHLGNVFQSADLAMAATPGGVRSLCEMGVEAPHLLPLGVDLATFSPGRRSSALREELLGSDPEGRLLVFLGRLDNEKRVPLLVEAFRRARQAHPNVHLLVVGDGPLLGRVPEWRSQVPGFHHSPWEGCRLGVARLLASADAYVTAGPYETFGLSVLEAQACGLPVLGVRAGALAERVDRSSGWLVTPDDAEALAVGMGKIASLPLEGLRERGHQSRLHALKGGGWEAVFQRLFALYGLPPHAVPSESEPEERRQRFAEAR